VQADQLPNLGLSVSAGRYGVLEDRDDYSVVARATLRLRLSGGFNALSRQAQARADAAGARADRVRRDAERDALIAWNNVTTLDEELTALEDNYKAARTSRTVLLERFRVSRGTLFDLLDAEERSVGAALGYVETLARLDMARFVLLARTDKLLDSLGIHPEQGRVE
jgi:outer membrane protein, adhesin transport system